MRFSLAVLCLALSLACTAASASAETVAQQFTQAGRDGLISSEQAEQAIMDFSKLRDTPGRDWQNMAQGIDRLAERQKLYRRAPMVVHALRVFAWKGDRPLGERVKSGPAAVVQRYAGQGWQVMPLASASRVNALAGGSFSTPSTLRATEALQAMLVPGDKSSRFEYLFPWLGGDPGWISGMTQSILACAFARMFERTGDRRWQRLSDRAIQPLLDKPPSGTGLLKDGSLQVLLYPWRDRFNVMNAQLWATWALLQISLNLPGADYRERYERAASFSLASMPGWASGANWTLYASGSDPLSGKPASRSYHELSVQALRRLCAEDERFCRWSDRFGAKVPASVRSSEALHRLTQP